MAYQLGKELRISDTYFVDDREPFIGVFSKICEKHGLSADQFRRITDELISKLAERHKQTKKYLAAEDLAEVSDHLRQISESAGAPKQSAANLASETIASFKSHFKV